MIRINEQDSSTGDGRTPLAKAIVNGRADIIDLLLATKGIDVNAIDSHNRSIWLLASNDLRVRLEEAGVKPGSAS
jgi:ankyrin repeat protein